MPVLSGIPLYLGISQLVCIWLKFIALCRCLFVCVVTVSLLVQMRKSWCLLLVAADTDSCGGVGCFHLVLSQWKQPSPQLKADQTAKSLPRWWIWFHNYPLLTELHYVSPFCMWKKLNAVACKVKCLDQRTKCTHGGRPQ